MELPQIPDQEWFRESLQEIVIRLQERTNAKIALISIPPIGEDPDHFAFQLSSEYSNIIEEVARITGTTYLPFREKMLDYLKEHPGNPTYPFENANIGMIKASFKRYILRRDWDTIGKSKGFQLHIDYLHLNTKSASMLTNLVEEFIKSS